MIWRPLRQLDLAIGQRHGYGCHHDLRDANTPCDSDLARGGRRQVDDTTLDVGTAIFDRDDGALPGGNVGDSRHGSEREGPARGVVAARIHRSAIRHGLAEELGRVIRGVAAALSGREI